MTHSSNTRNKTIYVLISAAGLILMLLWMQGAFEHKVPPGLSDAVAADEAPLAGQVVTVQRRSEQDVLAWPGTVAARTVTSVASKIPARIVEITVNGGARVTKGQVLVRLDEREIRARLDQAKANVAAANAEAQRARADAQRYQNLFNKQSATRRDLENAQAAARAAEAQVQAAREGVREAESVVGETVLRAPFDSVVVKRNLEPGDMAMPGAPVVTLQQSRQLRIEAAIPAQCAGLVRIGAELTARIANPQKTFRTVVDEIQPAADPETRTVLVKARLPDGAEVPPGSFGWLDQACGTEDTLVVPATAVGRIGQLESVRLTDDGRTSRLRHVRTGKRFGDLVEILSGLKEGDKVLVPEAGR